MKLNLHDYMGKRVRVKFVHGRVIEGIGKYFSGKLDTEDELYDELTVKTDDYKLFCFNETEVESIEVIE